MKKFPGEIARYGGGNGRKYHMSDEQLEWFRRWYPCTENARLAKAMGVYIDRVRVFARELGLEKSAEGLKAINRRRVKRATMTNEKSGYYASKRGKPVSAATMEGQRRRWQKIHSGELESPVVHLRNSDPKRYAEMLEHKRTERSESIRKEKLRMFYGLSRQTKLKPVVMHPYSRSQLHHRGSALKRGYLLDCDCSEGSPGRYTIYYDDETERSAKFEANCIRDGFRIIKNE